MPKQIDVVGAVIVRDGNVFCARRGPDGSLPGKWEFPGGKIESGEAPADALVREIREELDCDIRVGDRVTTTSHEYPFGVVNLTTFYCELVAAEPVLSEHDASIWLAPAALDSIEWAPADEPAVEIIKNSLATL